MASVPTKTPVAPRMRRVRRSERERKYIHFLLGTLKRLQELGQNLLGVELEKTFLIRPDLVDPDVRITRLGGLRDSRNVTCGIRTTDDCLRDLLLSDGAGSLCKMGRESEV